MADSCAAIFFDSKVYHYDANVASVSKFVADTIPLDGSAWTNPVFSNDFSFVAGDAGLYKYTAGTKTYASVLATAFYTNKKIWTTSTSTYSAIVVFSWKDTDTTNVKDYSVEAFAIPTGTSTTYTSIGKIDGKHYDTNVAASGGAPKVSISDSLKTIVVYGKTDDIAFFVKGKVLDYTAKAQSDLTFPTTNWFTTTESVVDVSDQYLYARNIADKTGAAPGTREHGGYYIVGK